MKHNTLKQFTKARNKAVSELKRSGNTCPTEYEIALKILFGSLKQKEN